MVRFWYLTVSVPSLNRLPPQTWQGTNTSARKCISTRITPAPWQCSHRPPVTLKENLPGL